MQLCQFLSKNAVKVAGATGLEPATTRSTVWDSNQIELRPPKRSPYNSPSRFDGNKKIGLQDLQFGQILDVNGSYQAAFSVHDEKIVNRVIFVDLEDVDGELICSDSDRVGRHEL